MKKFIAIFFVLLMISGCASADVRIKTFSILGDSWSTFEGYTTPKTNAQWYPTWSKKTEGYKTDNNVYFLTDTWWQKLISSGLKLIENRSYSGSPICYDGYGEGTQDAKNISFVKRVKGIKNANVIIVEGGINDYAAGARVGEYKYSNWTEEDFEYFRPALAYVLNYLKTKTRANILFMKCDWLSEEISTSIDTICEHYNVSIIYLHDINIVNWHPDINGMTSIFLQTIDKIQQIGDIK